MIQHITTTMRRSQVKWAQPVTHTFNQSIRNVQQLGPVTTRVCSPHTNRSRNAEEHVGDHSTESAESAFRIAASLQAYSTQAQRSHARKLVLRCRAFDKLRCKHVSSESAHTTQLLAAKNAASLLGDAVPSHRGARTTRPCNWWHNTVAHEDGEKNDHFL